MYFLEREDIYRNNWKNCHESTRRDSLWELKAYSFTLNVFLLLLCLQIFAIVA